MPKKKVVESFKTDDFFYPYEPYFYYVGNCPIIKKTWKSGFKKDKSYAAYEDCTSCIYCISKDSYKEIQCIGHLKKDLPALLKQLK